MSGDEDAPEHELDAESEPLDQEVRRERRKQQSDDDIRREQAETFWKQIFANPVGRREMWALLQQTHPFETRFACSPTGFPQPEATWFHAGEQDFGLRLYHSWMALDPEGVMSMQREFDPRFQKRDGPKRKARGQS